ncbi:MAG: amidohydrolase family protein [Anaerolineales bacterium]|nr:amidohydrolase family protein [Anaerolineales bacterium]
MTLTNAHTHLELTNMRHLCPQEPVDFADWIRGLAGHQSLRTSKQIMAGIEQGIAELQASGVTYVGDINTSQLSFEPLARFGLKGIVYLEVFWRGRGRALRLLERVQEKIREIRRHPLHGDMQIGLTIHAPYSCHPELFRRGAAWCKQEAVPLCIHIAESQAEVDLLADGSGPFGEDRWYYRWPQKLGIFKRLPTGLRPVEYLASLGVLEARPLLVHAIRVNDEDIRMIADSGSAVVHCPRSNHLLSCGRMPLEQYLAAGVDVYLGTDSRVSSPDLDIRAEAEFAKQLHQGFVAPEAIDALLVKPFPCEN